MSDVVVWQRVEGLIVFAAGLLVLMMDHAGLPWWGLLLIFFAPDLSFAGYALGNKLGAFFYNAVHVYGLGAALFAVGTLLGHPVMTTVGILWLAHSGFDRMLGYGLKTTEGFTKTHLGEVGKKDA